MSDISPVGISYSDRLFYDIFDVIAKKGPITVYATSKETGMALATVHRHFKEMEKEGEIVIYKEEGHKSGHRKKLYGPTALGVMDFCFLTTKLAPVIDFIFDKWTKEEIFLSDLISSFGFDRTMIEKDPQKSKENMKKVIQLYIDAFNELDNADELPPEMVIDVGLMLLYRKNPEQYLKVTKELYRTLPGFRFVIEQYFQSILKFLSLLKES